MADEETTEVPAVPAFTYQAPAVWKLTGAAGSKNLDLLVTFCVTVGLSVEPIEPGAYRVWGAIRAVQKAVDWVKHHNPAGPLSLDFEQPPDRPKLKFEVTPRRAPPRVAVIHGNEESERMVARAIDAGLTVWCVGIGRFKVTGQTRDHVAWMQALFAVDRGRALQIMNLTDAEAAAEDSDAPPLAVNVVLPPRVTTSDITRDRAGDITQIRQLERDA